MQKKKKQRPLISTLHHTKKKEKINSEWITDLHVKFKQ